MYLVAVPLNAHASVVQENMIICCALKCCTAPPHVHNTCTLQACAVIQCICNCVYFDLLLFAILSHRTLQARDQGEIQEV